MMIKSREAVVDYMTPLACITRWPPVTTMDQVLRADLARPEWNPVYYNHADAKGLGFDRTLGQ